MCTRLVVALHVLVITSVCIVSHSTCDAQINYESLESCLLHEYKLKHMKVFVKKGKETRYLLLLCVSHAMHEGSGPVPVKFD